MATNSSYLIKQQISISLTGGIDRKTDPKQLTNGQMYTADNVQYVTESQCRKRFGYKVLSPPGGLQGAPFAAVGCRDGVEPVILGTGALNRYNTQTGLSTYISAPTQGRLSSQVVSSSSGQTTLPTPPVGAAYASDNSSYLCIAWLETGLTPYSFFYGLQDLVTGNWILSPKQVPVPQISFTLSGTTYNVVGISGLRVAYVSGYFYIFYTLYGLSTGSSSAAQVYAYGLNTFNGQAGVSLTNFTYTLYGNSSVASAYPLFLYDIGVLNGLLYFAAATNPFGNVQLTAYTLNDLTFTTSTTQTLVSGQTGSSTISSVSMAVSNNNQALAIGTPGYLYRVSVPSFTYLKAATANGDANYSQTVCWVGSNFYYFNAGAVNGRVRLYGSGYNASMVLQASIVSEGLSTTGLTNILTAPFYANGFIYIWAFTQGYGSSVPYRSQILLQISPITGNVLTVARTAYQSSVYTNIKTQALPAPIVQIPGTNKFMAYLSQSTIIQDQSHSYGSLSRVVFDVTPARLPQIYNLPAGGNMIAGAFPLLYDGQSLDEIGFTNAPEFNIGIDSIAASPQVINTGGGILAGTYTWYACFARVDAYGNIIRSAPSTAFTATLTGSANQVKFPAISYNNVRNVFIEYYRTTIASPSQPYYVGRTTNGAAFIDIWADSNIVTNFNLYTYSGEYPNDPPPPVHHMAVGETRAFIIPSDNRNSIWCSKKYSPGRTVEWTSNLILSEGGTHGGQFTAIAVLDTNVIVFKQDQILYFYGDGPDNTGASGSFSAFQRLSSDVGCIDPGSIAVIPGGLLFRSQRGIELLTRGLQVQYVGAPVEPLVQAISSISSTCVLSQYQQVRFVSNVAGDPVLVYDYMHNRWSTYSNMSALSCANVLGNYWWISQDGTTCNMEDSNTFTDNGNFIPMTLETPEIPMAGIQGWGRLYRLGVLGEYKSPHTLLTFFAYDHTQQYTDMVTYSVIDIQQTPNIPGDAVLYDASSNMKADIVSSPAPEQFRLSRVPRQVMQTVRIMLQDTPYNGYYTSDSTSVSYESYPGESCAISNITLEVGQKAILAKLPGSKTV